jgi:hypothetical protein
MQKLCFKMFAGFSTLVFVLTLVVQIWGLFSRNSIEYTWKDKGHREILWFDVGLIDYQYDDWGGAWEGDPGWEFRKYPSNWFNFNWRTLGFRYEDTSFPPGVGRHLHLGIPYWPVLLATSFIPIRLTKKYAHHLTKKHRRRRRGLCENCGYDLRASTDRCPECGAPIVQLSEMPSN